MGAWLLRNREFSPSHPAVIVPVMGADHGGVVAGARESRETGADVIEWRVDAFVSSTAASADREAFAAVVSDQVHQCVRTARAMREVVGDTPLLLTVRSGSEGGMCRQLTSGTYGAFVHALIDAGVGQWVDACDVEIRHDGVDTGALIRAVAQAGMSVVGSHHRFDSTPDDSHVRLLLEQMHEAGPDVVKLAVMPHSFDDVLRLMRLTREASERLRAPLLTMSMGELGAITRLAWEPMGTCGTFASVGEASAPGQLPAARILPLLGR